MSDRAPALFMGEGAHLLPDPYEVAQSYNPLEYLIGAPNHNIAAIPGEPGLLLRWSPQHDHRRDFMSRRGYPSTEEGITAAASDAHEQFQILSDTAGLGIATHRTTIGCTPPGGWSPGPVALTVVKRVETTKLTRTDGRGVAIVASLADYIRSEQRKRTQRIASDIYEHQQYRGPLIDVDPCVAPERDGFVVYQMGALTLYWAAALGIQEHDSVQQLRNALDAYPQQPQQSQRKETVC